MLPTKLLSKVGTYNIKIQGATVTVRVADRPAVVCNGLCELRSLIETNSTLGLTIKTQATNGVTKPVMLQLCVGNRCLVVLLTHLNAIPSCLRDFLTDHEIYFMGLGITKAFEWLKYSYGIDRTRGYFEIGELAARYLKKPTLFVGGIGLDALATEVGISLEESPKLSNFNWVAKVFTDQEIKYAIHDAYGSHLIGTKLLAML